MSENGERSFDAARDRLVGYLVDFVRALRDRGVDVPADGGLAAARALAAVGLEDRERVRIALRSALVSREADGETFDALFPAFWRQLRGEDDHHVLDPAPEMSATGSAPGAALRETGGEVTDRAAPDADLVEGADGTSALAGSGAKASGEAGREDDGEEAAASVYSPAGVREGVADVPAGGEDRIEGATERFVDALAGLPGRRWTRHGTGRVDVRRALRGSVAAGGSPLPLPRRDRERDAARVVLLVDVSRSVLDTVDRRFLLRFAAALRRACRFARVFFFDTSLREVTGAFGGSSGPDPDDADGSGRPGSPDNAGTPEGPGAALERAEMEWGGGTRIGHSISRLREDHPAAVDRRTVVLVVSDGLEVGELDDLEAAMAWLSRRSRGVLWLNPLAGSSGYEPTCRGMERSLPYVDGLFAFAGAADLEEIARQLDRHGIGGPVGYRYDPRLDASTG